MRKYGRLLRKDLKGKKKKIKEYGKLLKKIEKPTKSILRD
jgi:hypothetical protein